MKVGDRVRNRFTKEEDVIERIGPCDNLHGQTRVWLRDQQARWPSNGWSVSNMDRCWDVVAATPHGADS